MSKIFCLKCKERTDTVHEEQKGNRMTGLCMSCGTKKSVFTKKQKGEGEIHQKLSQAAYDKEAKPEVDGYKIDESLSNKKTRVYHNPETKDTIVSHRGTDPKDKNDLKNDALLTLGLLNKKTSKRVKNADDITKKATDKYGDVTNVGHSLGGYVAKESQKKGQKVEAYNAGASPITAAVDVVKGIVSKKERNKQKNVTDNLTVIDPISISNLLNPLSKKKVTAPTKVNIHSIDNFKK
jgi:hypothetical protein